MSRALGQPIPEPRSNVRPLFPTPAGITPYDHTSEKPADVVAVDRRAVHYALSQLEVIQTLCDTGRGAAPAFPQAHRDAIKILREALGVKP